ncbi:MAG: methyltransferase domain-containing protein [Sedimenticola sp.]|nr:methyltransferase domain-containing protein [Sedimenticola sp.]
MDNGQRGSYKIDSMDDPQGELSRLKRQGELFKEIETRTLRQCGLKNSDSVLELGCGPGFVTKILAEIANEGALISVDNDPDLLSQLNSSEFIKPKKGFRSIEASADSLPLEDDWSDFSYARFLLQHVTTPQSVVNEAYRCTKPGGLFCAVDSDDGLILHYPEDKAIDQFLSNAQSKQIEYGGDRFIGRKLFNSFKCAGFENIKASVLSLTTTEVPPEILFGILFGYKSTLVGDSDNIKAFLASLTKRAEHGDLLLSAGVYIVVGQKPLP